MENQKGTNVESLLAPTVLSNWPDAPEPVLLEIFSYLGLENPVDLCHAGVTCQRWYQVSRDELLWKKLFKKRWGIGDHEPIRPGASSWREEYIRLVYHSPSVLADTVREHQKSIEHVSSSNNGKLCATCSRDVTVKVWQLQLTKPMLTLKHEVCMDNYWWATVLSKFNKDDTMLLVVGSNYRTCKGGIAVFSLADESMSMVCLIEDHPWQMYSNWYNETSFLYGDMAWYQPSVYKCTALKQKNRDVSRLCRVTNNIRIGIRLLQKAVVRQPHQSNVKEYLVYCYSSGQYSIGDLRVYDLLRIKLLSGSEENEERDAPEEHTIQLLPGTATGVALSPDHKFLYVNVRELTPTQETANAGCNRWAPDDDSSDSSDDSNEDLLFQDYTIQVIDMITKTICEKVYHGHKGVNLKSFYNHLDVSNQYLSSGSLNVAYIWDRYYGVKLASLEHGKMVTCVCFNNEDEEMLLSGGNDKTLRVWISRNRQREHNNIK